MRRLLLALMVLFAIFVMLFVPSIAFSQTCANGMCSLPSQGQAIYQRSIPSQGRVIYEQIIPSSTVVYEQAPQQLPMPDSTRAPSFAMPTAASVSSPVASYRAETIGWSDSVVPSDTYYTGLACTAANGACSRGVVYARSTTSSRSGCSSGTCRSRRGPLRRIFFWRR